MPIRFRNHSSKVEGVPRKDQEHFTTSFSNASLLQISQQIKALDVHAPSTSCIDKTRSQIDKGTSSEMEDEENDNNSESDEDTLNVITKIFDDEQDLGINKINYGNKSTMRNYYSRPSPADLQYEE